MKNLFFYVFTVFLSFGLNIKAQSEYDVLINFAREDFLEFEYQYKEFDPYAYSDSMIILNSFNGIQTVFIDTIKYYNDSIKYCLTIKKEGLHIQRNFWDTLLIEDIKTISTDFIVENFALTEHDSDNQIYGWLFPEYLYKSVDDSFDTIGTYPYSKIYRYYFPNLDDSLFFSNDTMLIHYRPELTNYYDSYYSTDFYIIKNNGLIGYKKHYSYYGSGFLETYKLIGVGLIEDAIEKLPRILDEINVNQNYPNPFNPTTVISWQLAVGSHVELNIFNVLGQKIATLVNEKQTAGTHTIEWDASKVSSGIYYYRLTTDQGYFQVRKMMVLK
jgi:hypothetical protein